MHGLLLLELSTTNYDKGDWGPELRSKRQLEYRGNNDHINQRQTNLGKMKHEKWWHRISFQGTNFADDHNHKNRFWISVHGYLLFQDLKWWDLTKRADAQEPCLSHKPILVLQGLQQELPELGSHVHTETVPTSIQQTLQCLHWGLQISSTLCSLLQRSTTPHPFVHNLKNIIPEMPEKYTFEHYISPGDLKIAQ
jgi:hypothetical protein